AGMNLLLYDQEDCPPEDEKPNPLEGSAKDDQESSPSDLPVHIHNPLPASFDERLVNVAKDVEEIAQRVSAIDETLAKQALAKANAEAVSLAEREQQAKNNMLTMLRDLGTDSDPLDVLQNGVRLCSDDRLWQEPAKDETRYQDTERFYSEEKVWPTIRDNQIIWSLRPDYDPPDDAIVFDGDEEPSVKQASFRPFRCCSRCKYIGKSYSFCAVVPFGCTGDPGELCREFEEQDSSAQVAEFTDDDIPF
ncbi:MAG: hypothetical protein HC768_20650, partial [Acaryochloris sp. CRU_2_0]|nr:hypothetical protein [Acaryochloris sp. CRU_2_0]